MIKLWEPGIRFRKSLRGLPRAIGGGTVSAGVVTYLMVLTGPALLIYQAATESGFTAAQTGSWYFAVFVAAGLLELTLALGYGQPIAAGVALPSVALLAQVLPGFTIHEAVGAYLTYGTIILALGLTGGFGRLMGLIPVEVIMGMVAGLLLRFGVAVFTELVAEPLLVAPIVLAWLAAGRWLHRSIPPLAVALVVGVALALMLHPLAGQHLRLAVALPQLYAPTFDLRAFLSLSLPLLLLILSAQNVSGIGVLRALGFRAPANAITLATGLFTMVCSLMAGHGVALGSPRSGICADPASHPEPGLRYGAVVVDATLLILSGAFAPTLVRVFQLLPLGMIRTLAGLAMFPVIQQVLEQGFRGGRHRLGTLFALLISASNVSWLGVSAVFWALLLGPLISLAAEGTAARREA